VGAMGLEEKKLPFRSNSPSQPMEFRRPNAMTKMRSRCPPDGETWCLLAHLPQHHNPHALKGPRWLASTVVTTTMHQSRGSV
jgi:hypothetical protein